MKHQYRLWRLCRRDLESEVAWVHTSGSGDVHYVGDPKVEQSLSGSGDVVRLGE